MTKTLDELSQYFSQKKFAVIDLIENIEIFLKQHCKPALQKEREDATKYEDLIQRGNLMPIIFITGHGDIPMTVDALKSGAVNFIEKPFRNQVLLDSIYSAIKIEERNRANEEVNDVLIKNFSFLTEREKQVSNYISQGLVSKQIAEKLHLSPRTIESHRANILKKMNSANTFDLMKKLIQINSILVSSK